MNAVGPSCIYDIWGNQNTVKITDANGANPTTLVTNTYANADGNLLQSTYGNGTAQVGNTYNTMGQLVDKNDYAAGVNYQYNYDLSGRMILSDRNNGSSVSYGYDNMNRLPFY